jgi:hypothetical protein
MTVVLVFDGMPIIRLYASSPGVHALNCLLKELCHGTRRRRFFDKNSKENQEEYC